MSAIPLTFDNLAKVSSPAGYMYSQSNTQSTDSVETGSTASTIKLAPAEPRGTTGVISNTASESSLPVPPSLIRKKSGELVKSSLRLSALGRSASSPQLVANKSVRFASRLANVRMFDGTESPSTVSTNDNTPMGSPIYSDDMSHRSSYFQWNLDEDEISDITSDEEGATSTSNKYVIDYSDLRTHRSVYEKPNSPIYLQSLDLNYVRNELNGFVLVKNLAFEKHVSVKFTLNGWKSSMTLNNVKFFKSLPSANVDQFKFQIPLHGLSNYLNIELVLKYEVAGATYWDNNQNLNYRIKLRPFDCHSTPTGREIFKKDDSQFDVLINRLTNYKYSSFDDVDDQESKPPSPSKQKSEFHRRYNFAQELEADPFSVKDTSTAFLAASSRPPLKQSFSTSDIINVKPKYSHSFKSKQKENQSVSTFNETKFNSKSYSDLLSTYCFYNGEKSNTLEPAVNGAVPAYISSPASTFHSLSDSIHI